MKKSFVKMSALVMAGTLALSMPGMSVLAAENAGPETVTVGIAGSVGGVPLFRLDFAEEDAAWLKAVQKVSVDGVEYTKSSWINMMPGECEWYAEEGFDYSAYKSTYYLRLTNDKEDTTDYVVSAEGYEDVTIHVEKQADGSYKASLIGKKAEEEKKEDAEETGKKPISASQVSLSAKSGRWVLSFEDADDYVSTITSLSVNGKEWEAQDYDPYTGGKYYPVKDANQIKFVTTAWTVQETGVLKSGDVIKIESSDYEDLALKFTSDGYSASISEDDGKGDIYALYVKLKGFFESAISGQEEYDGVTAATGVASTSKSSNVTVYAAMGEKDVELDEEAWQELGLTSDIQIDPNKTKVSIVPDTSKGTPADSDSGLEGVYLSIDSGLTLTGSPKDPGDYLVTVTLTDMQGREAVSEPLPLRIYSGKETLAERLAEENLTQTSDGKYMWKNMEPWTIGEFGSNVEGEQESVRVPEGLKAWYGSNESGLYGNLGYAISWADVKNGNIPQTLYVPSGCDLTMVNMEIQSSVKIVVENGGKLTLRDSVVQGVIDVQNGGTFSMNYNGFGSEAGFMTGASVDGQIILEDGAILENAAVVSHANYIANGNVNDRTTSDAVVVANGNVTVKGQVFISGDEAGANPSVGQTGLLVQNGTLNLEDGSVLAVYGGAGKVALNATGGTAVVLKNGEVTGNGKLIAVGGAGQFGNGGNAISGDGTISTAEVFLQGANTRESQEAGKAGSANPDGIKIKSEYQSVKDGVLIDLNAEDPMAPLYWNVGVDATPDLTQYSVEKVVVEESKTEEEKTEDTEKEDPKTDDQKKEDQESKSENKVKDCLKKIHNAFKKAVKNIVKSIRNIFRW